VFGHVGRQAQRHVGFLACAAGVFGLAARQVDQEAFSTTSTSMPG
jgi:hypothetical protein